MQELQLDIAVTRGGTLESVHQVHAAAVDPSGAVVARARNPELVTHWRSCAKPFQAMPFVEAGGLDELGWGDDRLALACASHGGEPEHVALATAMLADLGLAQDALACGPHEPLSDRGARLLRESGSAPTRIHNNCSGKHAAMLARAKTAGWPTAGYHTAPHEVQKGCLASVSLWSGVAPDAIGRAVDGCGVVEFALPLRGMATAYARLGEAAGAGVPGPARVVRAMVTHPFLVGGTGRFDTVLMEETKGRVICKVGAEGVHTAVSLDRGIGVAIKAEDGATRAQYPALVRALQLLDLLPASLPPRLAEFSRRPITNTRGEVVGEIAPVA
ncbi:MAG: asparaginase [Gemmatimonadota bacterium]|nr:asparaginase [Gemmatimonadota bacterium]